MKTILLFFIALFSISISNEVFSQQIKFVNYNTDEGLSNNSVLDIENDNNGGLWVATWDGLNYYDGYGFTIYKHDDSNEKSIQGNHIANIEKDAEGNIWAFESSGKLSRYIGNGEFQNVDLDIVIKNIHKSKRGNIVARGHKASYEYIEGEFIKTATIIENNIEEEYKFFRKILLSKYPDHIINDILKDDNDNVWIATRRNGLYVIPNSSDNVDNTRIDHYYYDYYSSYSLASNEVKKIHKDNFGNIWLGQKDGGLSMAYKGSEQIFTIVPHPVKYPHLPNQTIRAITKDGEGVLWLGYYTKGVFYFDNEKECYLKFRIKESEKNTDWERVRSLYYASDDSVWVGTYAGLIRIKKGKYTLYEAAKEPNLPNNRTYSIFEDAAQQLWIACWGGIAKFNLNKNDFEEFKGQELLTQYNIRTIKKNDNELIIGTERDGTFLLDLKTSTLRHISKADGILGNSVYSLYKDESNGNYWIASLGGLSIFNKKDGVVKNLTEKDGLPSHMVYGLLGNEDQVWLSTTKGIAFVDKTNFKISVAKTNEGWQAKEFSEGAFYQDPKGILYFGGVNGLNYFSPNAISFEKNIPQIKVNVKGEKNLSKLLKRVHSENDLNISLAPIVFPASKSTTFYYKLKGIDEDWIKAEGKMKNIRYENLPSGYYTFCVRNEHDPIGKEAFLLQISKAFYETISFYVLTLFFLMGSSFVFIYKKNKGAQLQKKKLEDKIIERTKVIEEQKENLIRLNDKLGEKNEEVLLQKEKLLNLHNNLKSEDFEVDKFKTFVLSEFQKPIAEILKVSNKIQDDSQIQKELLHHSGKIINLISEWNYLDNIKNIGNKKKTSVNLMPVLKSIIEKLKDKLKANNVSFNGEIDTNIAWVEIDLLRFRLLLQYLFNNIIKYSGANSNVNLSVKQDPNQLNISLASDSTILRNNWSNVAHFSPYFKAFKVLIKDLEGKLEIYQEENLEIQFNLPVTIIDTSSKKVETISWKHLDLKEKLPTNKNNILVFTDVENYETANQLLDNEEDNLLFESSVSNLSSALQLMNITVFVLYQATFGKDLVNFLKTYKEQTSKRKVPLVYISEEINYTLREQSIEFGIDIIIQLPANELFIRKKINSLIHKNEKVTNNKYQQEIFKILTEEGDLLTTDEKLLKSCLEVIKEQLSNSSFNVEKLISQLKISRTKCYRLFKEHLNQSPSDVITSLRLQKAEYLLRNKKLNISEIGFECGYSDSKYFGRSFKKYFGVSPKNYKEQKS